MHKYLTPVALCRFLDDIGAGELVGGDVFHDQMSKIEVVGAVPRILIAVAGGGESDITAVVGTESVPERVTNPFVARTTVVDVGDLALLVEGNSGLALVGRGLVASAADGKCLVDGEALEADNLEVFRHELSPGCTAETAKDELAELMGGDSGAGAIAVVEAVREYGELRAGWVAELVDAVLPLDGRQLLLAEEVFVAVAEGGPSHALLIGILVAPSSAGRSLDEAVHPLSDEGVEVTTVREELDILVAFGPLLGADANGFPALPGDLQMDVE